MSKKSATTVQASNVQPGPFGGGDPLPTTQAPVPPSTTDAPVTRVEARRGRKPLQVQVEAAGRAADEIRTGADTYTEVFGARAPAATTVADALAYAAGWSASLAAAERWRDYCAAQNRVAWGHSLGLVERLHPLVQAPGSTAAADLPQLTAVVTARTPVGKRAAATLKNKKKTAEQASAPTPAPAAVAPTPVPSPSPALEPAVAK